MGVAVPSDSRDFFRLGLFETDRRVTAPSVVFLGVFDADRGLDRDRDLEVDAPRFLGGRPRRCNE